MPTANALAATPVFGHGPHETGSESNDGGGFVIGTGIYNVEETSVHAKSKCFHVIFQVVKEDGGGAKNRENLKEFDTVGCVQNPVERLHPLHFYLVRVFLRKFRYTEKTIGRPLWFPAEEGSRCRPLCSLRR